MLHLTQSISQLTNVIITVDIGICLLSVLSADTCSTMTGSTRWSDLLTTEPSWRGTLCRQSSLTACS